MDLLGIQIAGAGPLANSKIAASERMMFKSPPRPPDRQPFRDTFPDVGSEHRNSDGPKSAFQFREKKRERPFVWGGQNRHIPQYYILWDTCSVGSPTASASMTGLQEIPFDGAGRLSAEYLHVAFLRHHPLF